MHFDIIANAHANARTGIDPVQARLGGTPQAESGRELLVNRPGQGEAAVDEPVAVMKTDDAALQLLLWGVVRAVARSALPG